MDLGYLWNARMGALAAFEGEGEDAHCRYDGTGLILTKIDENIKPQSGELFEDEMFVFLLC